MNRAERRQLSKGNKKVNSDLKYLNTSVSLAEAVQIARGVAEDVVSDYQQRSKPLQVVTSLQLELIKDIIIKAGLITEEEYHKRYVEQVEEFNAMQRAALGEEEEKEEESSVEDNSPKIDAKVSDIEVTKI